MARGGNEALLGAMWESLSFGYNNRIAYSSRSLVNSNALNILCII